MGGNGGGNGGLRAGSVIKGGDGMGWDGRGVGRFLAGAGVYRVVCCIGSGEAMAVRGRAPPVPR